MIYLIVVLFALTGKSLGQCPHNETGLNRWSEASTWAGGTVSSCDQSKDVISIFNNTNIRIRTDTRDD